MNDEKDHPYSEEELRDALVYVAETTPNAACPFCGNSTWAMESDKSKPKLVPKVVFAPFTNRAFFGPAPAIPTISLTCENCGFIRLHNLPMVMTKLNDGGSE